MNKEEVLYERTISSSYMKIPAWEEDSLDMRILLKRKLKGLIPIERCYVNGKGQYWYDISGKQALDSFIKVKVLEYSLFERLILQICEQIELLEWNLLDVNGLLIDPEYIFLNINTDEFSFVFYPQKNNNLLSDLQSLLEYLLSKVSHTDRDSMKEAYALYEMSLNEGCQIQELKHSILKRRMQQKEILQVSKEMEEIEVKDEKVYIQESESAIAQPYSCFRECVEDKVSKFCKKFKQCLTGKSKEEVPMVVYPQEEEPSIDTCHPTICIATVDLEPRGVLIYEGKDDYPDYEIHKTDCTIGKNAAANLRIVCDTVSNFHAKIEYNDGYYIEDMNSTNGTFVNEEIINYRQKRKLNAGDVIRFADTKYRFL